MLAKIDPDRMKGGRWTSKKENSDGGVAMSRVELLNHAHETLERLHTENEERKAVISDFSRGGSVASRPPSIECGLSGDPNVNMTTEVSLYPMYIFNLNCNIHIFNSYSIASYLNTKVSTDSSTEKVGFAPQGSGPDNIASSTAAELQAAAIVQQHQFSMLLNGGLGYNGLHAFSGGIFPVVNPVLVGPSKINTGLHALLMARRLNGSQFVPLPASSLDLPILPQHQLQTRIVYGLANAGHEQPQVHQNTSATTLGDDENDDTHLTEAKTYDTKKRKP